MSRASLNNRIQQRLWEVVDAQGDIISATLVGSILEAETLDAVSDIDVIVIVEQLNAECYTRLLAAFDRALRDELAEHGYCLRINPTLGPLKLNEPATAVLHLMLYTREAHVDHATCSPFTCCDWQRSTAYRKCSLAEVYPVFNLQPQHFISSRRSVRDYLRDFDAGVVSYRELVCDALGYHEQTRSKPMTSRDRHEFAFHIVRFLMQNLVKLVRRSNAAIKGQPLMKEYFAIFPDRQPDIRRFYERLHAKKAVCDFAEPLLDLEPQLRAFIDSFEAQFQRVFFAEATRHIAFRHAPTAANGGLQDKRVFLGRADPPLEPLDPTTWQALAREAAELTPRTVYSSPSKRCRQSLAAVAGFHSLPSEDCDERLREIDYGELEGLPVGTSRESHAGLFDAWARGEDPKFPGGENSGDVTERALAFVRDRWTSSDSNTLTCTHNVVLRCLIGHVLGIPPHHWHRLSIPHLAPVTFVQTRAHGLFVDVPTETARVMFRDFATST